MVGSKLRTQAKVRVISDRISKGPVFFFLLRGPVPATLSDLLSCRVLTGVTDYRKPLPY
jgi:hypothetical protein